jgi:hypothetical protein
VLGLVRPIIRVSSDPSEARGNTIVRSTMQNWLAPMSQSVWYSIHGFYEQCSVTGLIVNRAGPHPEAVLCGL